MGYFAAAALSTQAQMTQEVVPAHIAELMTHLSQTQVDELSPRQALDVLYQLKAMLEVDR